eukprot:TRINITY_DN32574_c0_g1_i1.p1 TRINITY_DN32574_c0_g1~~TRINITY_DN32574_c0_g1_i1.p1  ORF type:complete len:181 (+),score=15.14 TRINITY_DN32574_c0_g1_i1:171-713(+)
MELRGRWATVMLMALAMAVIVGDVEGQAQGQSGCSAALLTLSPCLSYVTGSSAAEPSSSCCSALANVVKNNAICLCQLLAGNSTVGVSVNETRALQLPSACKVSTPPVSKCKEKGFAVPPVSSSSPPSEGSTQDGNGRDSDKNDTTTDSSAAATSRPTDMLVHLMGFLVCVSSVSSVFFF